MLFLLLKFCYLLLLSIPYGLAAYECWHRYACRQAAAAYSFSLVALSGLMLTGVIAAYLSLIIPLAGAANGLLLAGSAVLWLLLRKAICTHASHWWRQLKALPRMMHAVFLLQIVFVLYLSARQSLAYDEGLYYIQFIKWMQQYPVVPGLANLHERFGFNSHWHVMSALFNGSFLTGQSCNQLNGLLYLLVALYFLPALQSAPNSISRWLKGGLLIMMHLPPVLVYNMAAPSADLVVFYLCALLFVLWMEAIEQRNGIFDAATSLFIFLLAAFLVTVKVSAITVLLLPALLLVRLLKAGAYRQGAILAALAVVIVLPWFIRNVVLSGYLLYPFEKLDLFRVDWKSPVAAVAHNRQLIHEWAFYMNKDSAVFHAATFPEKIRIWFSHNLRIYDKLLLLSVITLPFVFWWRKRLLPREVFVWILFLYAGIGAWFFQAPDPRFAYGFIIPACILLVYLLLMNINSERYAKAVIITGMLFFQGGTLLLYRHLHRQFLAQGFIAPPKATAWWMPVPYFEKPVTLHTAPFLYYTPVNMDRCWDAPLPCTYQLPEGVDRRGKTLGEGFSVKVKGE